MVARVTLEIALRKEFDYAIPPEFAAEIEVGSRVKVPFGPRQVLGIVTALVEETTHTNLRAILKVVGRQTMVTPEVLRLARWIGEYYCCPPETALKSVLPEAVRKEAEGWKERLFVRATAAVGEPPKLTKRQEEIWKLIQERRELPLTELLKLTGATTETIRRLEDKGLATIAAQVSERDPYANETIIASQPLVLNAEQSAALAQIVSAMDAGPELKTQNSKLKTTFLLHGVTGSGKTEIYLQAIAHTLAQGKGAIVLVPEIALTPQTVERFKARFSSGPLKTLVAVLHSHLSAGERHDEWHKIRQGRARIVIGARSAIFAPVSPLGLVIVDEEHEHSYKQEEAPRYHARDVAVVRGQMEGAVVVLGSATPSLESYHNAKRGKYALLEMPSRVDDKKMPIVRVVDMRQEGHKDKGTPYFSQRLKDAITTRLEKREQVILFLNRRGYATSLQCVKCGYVAECPNCSVSLTFHRRAQKICCHICGHEARVPQVCPEPKCRNPEIRQAGLGTERVEDTLVKLFPHARIARMDSDLMKRKEDYRRVLGEFKTGKVDLLVGTQMIAKGLHFENVTLVGVIYADLSLHVPDFRAGERTFQLLTQVAGRAGRGEVEGEVIVQAFTPFHPAIQFARRHDFAGFYEQEIEYRAQLNYPPHSRIALLTLRGRNEEKVEAAAKHLRAEVEKALGGKGAGGKGSGGEQLNLLGRAEKTTATEDAESAAPLKDVLITGPAAAPLARAETFYRWQLMLRTRQMTRLSAVLEKLLPKLALPEDITLAVDVDPVSLM
ncbi:MAG: primosomal protein N' [Verrucomicrobia bacterium]|nr:primosomal protein N' [Verrucomicrobiota bacterium]